MNDVLMPFLAGFGLGALSVIGIVYRDLRAKHDYDKALLNARRSLIDHTPVRAVGRTEGEPPLE